jgi:signal peptidase
MKWLLKIPIYLVCSVSLLLALGIVVPKLVFQIEPMAVQSGSMKPGIPVGSLVYAVPTDGEKIKVGDVISYTLGGGETRVTHRVVETDRVNKRFMTQGDANVVPDGSPVAYGSVIGVVKLRIPLAGYVFGFAQTKRGMIILATVIAAMILLVLIQPPEEKKVSQKVLLEPAVAAPIPVETPVNRSATMPVRVEPEPPMIRPVIRPAVMPTRVEPETPTIWPTVKQIGAESPKKPAKKKYSRNERYTPRY